MRRFLIAVATLPLLAFTAPSAPSFRAPLSAPNNRSIDSLYGDLTADQQVIHALNRLTFGPRPGDSEEIRRTGIHSWIERQLHPETINDDRAEHALAQYSMLHKSQEELSSEYATFLRQRAAARRAQRDSSQDAAQQQDQLRKLAKERTTLVREINAARVARAVVSERQLLEVMTDFWLNHFNVFSQKNALLPYYLADYDQTIRSHALGNFRDLLGAVAHAPAMLVYLDNAQSQANPDQPTLRRRRGNRQSTNAQQRGLNENYGRELLELHTLGVDGGYTQNDVIAVARALTGWSIKPPAQGGGFIFRPEWHDAAPKTILGKHFPAGRGEEEGEAVLDLLASHPSTAHFIAFKLARRFVSDTPPAALVDRATKRFIETHGDIREVLKTIILSPEFFSHAAYRAKVKSPFEVVVSTARALGAPADPTPKTALAIAALGQPIYGHQAPNGWPETGDAWMNTGAILNRINFGMSVAANRLPGVSITTLPWADSIQTAPRTQQVDAIIARILSNDASPDTRAILLSGENPLATTAAKQSQGFAQILGLALGAPEFQRR